MKEENKKIDILLTNYASLSQFEKIAESMKTVITLLEMIKILDILVIVDENEEGYMNLKAEVTKLIREVLHRIKKDDVVVYSIVISSMLRVSPT